MALAACSVHVIGEHSSSSAAQRRAAQRRSEQQRSLWETSRMQMQSTNDRLDSKRQSKRFRLVTRCAVRRARRRLCANTQALAAARASNDEYECVIRALGGSRSSAVRSVQCASSASPARHSALSSDHSIGIGGFTRAQRSKLCESTHSHSHSHSPSASASASGEQRAPAGRQAAHMSFVNQRSSNTAARIKHSAQHTHRGHIRAHTSTTRRAKEHKRLHYGS